MRYLKVFGTFWYPVGYPPHVSGNAARKGRSVLAYSVREAMAIARRRYLTQTLYSVVFEGWLNPKWDAEEALVCAIFGVHYQIQRILKHRPVIKEEQA